MGLLNEKEIETNLAKLVGWSRQGSTITEEFHFSTYIEGIRFVNGVAGLAEQANHHPDLLVRWKKVTVTLTSHDVGGLTRRDFQLAEKIDELIEVGVEGR